MTNEDEIKVKEIIKLFGNCPYCGNTGRVYTEFLYLKKIKQQLWWKCCCKLNFLFPNYKEIPKEKISEICGHE